MKYKNFILQHDEQSSKRIRDFFILLLDHQSSQNAGKLFFRKVSQEKC